MIGEQEDIDLDFREKISKSAAAHLITFSGIKISIFLSIFIFIFSKLGIKNNILCGINLLIILILGIVCKNTPAVKLALIINIIHILSFLLKKEADRLNSVVISALLLLVYNPYIMQNIGFIFSFSSSIAIIAFTDKLKIKLSFFKNIPKIGNFLCDVFAMNFSVIIGTLYFTTYYFNIFQIWAVVFNIFIIFIIYFVFAFAIFLAIFSPLSIYITSFLANILQESLEFVIRLIEELSKCEFFWFYVKRPSKILFFVYLILLFLFYKFLSIGENSEQEN